MYIVVGRDQDYANTCKYIIDQETGAVKVRDRTGRVWYLKQILTIGPNYIIGVDITGEVVKIELHGKQEDRTLPNDVKSKELISNG